MINSTLHYKLLFLSLISISSLHSSFITNTFQQDGIMKSEHVLEVVAKILFTGTGCLEAPIIEISTGKFEFTGTIICSERCTIKTNEPINPATFTRKGNGEFIIKTSNGSFSIQQDGSLIKREDSFDEQDQNDNNNDIALPDWFVKSEQEKKEKALENKQLNVQNQQEQWSQRQPQQERIIHEKIIIRDPTLIEKSSLMAVMFLGCFLAVYFSEQPQQCTMHHYNNSGPYHR